jgi:CDP-glucose 4,6-dehydratase
MNMDFKSSFKNKKVFLTGHTGFKGAWMSVWLSEMDAVVKGYALTAEQPSLYRMINTQLKNHQSVISDIRNKTRLEKEIFSFQPDFIFHMAAQPLVRESYTIPLETFEVNVMGTAHVLEAVKKLSKKCVVVIITTDKVYKNPENGKPFKEDDPLGGHDPYSSSKAAAEIITESYRLSFFHPDHYKEHKKSISTARAGNVIGGGDYAKDRIVPDIVKALQSGQPVTVRNPLAVRPWQHVLEPLSGYLTLAAAMSKEPQKFAGSYNFGPKLKDALPVETLLQQAIKNWGSGTYKTAKIKKAPHEAGLLKLDISKAAKELKWFPVWNAKEAIEKSVGWYKDSAMKNKLSFEFCLNDIKEYIKKR